MHIPQYATRRVSPPYTHRPGIDKSSTTEGYKALSDKNQDGMADKEARARVGHPKHRGEHAFYK